MQELIVVLSSVRKSLEKSKHNNATPANPAQVLGQKSVIRLDDHKRAA